MANHPDFAVVAFDSAIGDFVFDESADAFPVAFESQCKLLEGFEGGSACPAQPLVEFETGGFRSARYEDVLERLFEEVGTIEGLIAWS